MPPSHLAVLPTLSWQQSSTAWQRRHVRARGVQLRQRLRQPGGVQLRQPGDVQLRQRLRQPGGVQLRQPGDVQLWQPGDVQLRQRQPGR